MSAAHPAYMELIEFIASGSTPEAVIEFRPSESTQQRVSELIERKRDGLLSEEDASELDDCLQLEYIMIWPKLGRASDCNLAKNIESSVRAVPMCVLPAARKRVPAAGYTLHIQ